MGSGLKDGYRKFALWFGRVMQGRYGADSYSHFLSALTMILVFIGLLSKIRWFYIAALILVAYYYFRMFSKNLAARGRENQRYVTVRNKFIATYGKLKRRHADKKVNRYFKCPSCKQTVRVPKGHGKIEISCPKCSTKFIRKS